MARAGSAPDDIRGEIASRFGYDLSRSVDDIRPAYGFDETCQGSVPEAITAALESTGYEDAVRNAISLGGDADTQASIAGGIAQAMHGGVPEEIRRQALDLLQPKMRETVQRFEARFMPA